MTMLAHGIKSLAKIEARPIINMKLSWEDNPEISVRVMLGPGANVLVISETLVEEQKVPVVLRVTGATGMGQRCK